MAERLGQLGVAVTQEWAQGCQAHLRASVPGYDGLPGDRQLELAFGQFLACDLNLAGAGCLPPDLQARSGSASGVRPDRRCRRRSPRARARCVPFAASVHAPPPPPPPLKRRAPHTHAFAGDARPGAGGQVRAAAG
jgi:hypothetical protein